MFARNFEKTTKTTKRRSYSEHVEASARTGKRNKPTRGGKHGYQEFDDAR